MNDNKIDVIILLYNGDQYIKEMLLSVQNQTYPVSGIIICDDGSSDHGPEIVKEIAQSDHRITLIQLPHGGVSAARNAGIEASSGQYIAFLDADDVWLPTKLEYQMNVFESASPQVGFVHSSYFFINEHGADIDSEPVIPPKKRGDIFLPLLFERYVLSGSASNVLVRRDILDRVGYFDTELFHGEDWDLWIRLAQVCHVDFTSEPVVGIRIHSQSMQRHAQPDREWKFFQQHLIIFSKWREKFKAYVTLTSYLRRHAIRVIFLSLKKPKDLIRFYHHLSSQKNDLARNLFNGPLDFCWEISLAVACIIYSRLRRVMGIDG